MLILAFVLAVNCINYSFNDVTNATVYTYTFNPTASIDAQDRVSVLNRIYVPLNAATIQLSGVAK